MDVCRTFIKNLYSVIHSRGLRIGDVERDAGLSVGYVSRLRNSNNDFSLATAYKLSNIVGVSIDDLIDTESSLINRKSALEKELTEINRKLESIGIKNKI